MPYIVKYKKQPNLTIVPYRDDDFFFETFQTIDFAFERAKEVTARNFDAATIFLLDEHGMNVRSFACLGELRTAIECHTCGGKGTLVQQMAIGNREQYISDCWRCSGLRSVMDFT